MNQITEQLYQGNLDNVIEASKGNDGFGAIIFLAQTLPSYFEQSKVVIIHIPTNDEQEDELKLRLTSDVIHSTVCFLYNQTKKKVLVACMAGMSRSACACLLYIGRWLSFEDADDWIRKKIPEFDPEPNLYWQTRQLINHMLQ